MLSMSVFNQNYIYIAINNARYAHIYFSNALYPHYSRWRLRGKKSGFAMALNGRKRAWEVGRVREAHRILAVGGALSVMHCGAATFRRRVAPRWLYSRRQSIAGYGSKRRASAPSKPSTCTTAAPTTLDCWPMPTRQASYEQFQDVLFNR
jgi:hypothetical protein